MQNYNTTIQKLIFTYLDFGERRNNAAISQRASIFLLWYDSGNSCICSSNLLILSEWERRNDDDLLKKFISTVVNLSLIIRNWKHSHSFLETVRDVTGTDVNSSGSEGLRVTGSDFVGGILK